MTGREYAGKREVDTLRAEIDRLTALKTPATRQLLIATKAMLESAETEIASLEGAMQEMIEASKRDDAKIAKLRAALEPFAKAITEAEMVEPTDVKARLMECRWQVTLYEFGQACKALTNEQEK